MTSSDIEIVGENKGPEEVIILDSNDDSDDFFDEADERQDVIELDHALAKSSNVSSPQAEDLEADDSFQTAQTRSEIDATPDKQNTRAHDKDDFDDLLDKKDMPSDDDLSRLASRPLTRSNSRLSASPAKSPLKQSVTRSQAKANSKTNSQHDEPNSTSPKKTSVSTDDDDKTEDEISQSQTNATSKTDHKDNKPIEQVDVTLPRELPESVTKNSPGKILRPRSATKKSTPTHIDPDVPFPEDNADTDPSFEPEDNMRNEDTKYEASISASTSVKPDSEKPKFDNVPKESSSERTPSVSIQDDFFSMSYTPLFPEVKKKKKKKLKRKTSEEAEEPATQNNDNRSISAAATIPAAAQHEATTPVTPTAPRTESPRKKARVTRAVTPPPIDDAAFKRKFAEEHGEKFDPVLGADDGDRGIFDEDYEYKERIRNLDEITKSFNQEKDGSKSNDGGSRENSLDPSRSYVLHITSFLPGSENKAVDTTVRGSKKFHPVISTVLKELLNAKENSVPSWYRRIYEPDLTVLYWNKIKILDFMRPDTLQIPAPTSGKPTEITLGLYSIHQSEEIERLKEIERVEKRRRMEQEEKQAAEDIAPEIEEEEVDPFKDDELFKGIESEPVQSSVSREATVLGNGESEEGFFKIGLKGEDNKKMIVKVHAETKLITLVKYYLKQKKLPENTKVKLSFDDEDLDLGDTVGDTELEEDFTVDVIIKK